jgi:hypothetical protein
MATEVARAPAFKNGLSMKASCDAIGEGRVIAGKPDLPCSHHGEPRPDTTSCMRRWQDARDDGTHGPDWADGKQREGRLETGNLFQPSNH